MEETWLTLEQVAAACTVEPEWLAYHIEEGLFPHVEGLAGTWRQSHFIPNAKHSPVLPAP